MSKKEMKSVSELCAMPLHQFVARCLEWNEEFNEGKVIDTSDGHLCPVQVWVMSNHKNCPSESVVDLIATCKVCGEPMCPECSNHNVHQLSRVTGYLSNVSGWNAAKKQELQDRVRHNLKD